MYKISMNDVHEAHRCPYPVENNASTHVYAHAVFNIHLESELNLVILFLNYQINFPRMNDRLRHSDAMN